ncbi:MAG TPA: histidine--tRNA ligase [Bryobacteraceae bacterium]|nr:histidine--tRNA ligase [Bryobacteraceae bacterium]HOQ45726.1 histidine--tRNA ligase [Bryobacteraceae bacterium]HPQ15949.1 histidine--tRNA ligase [Bryobacteraceae bacterium]HPU71547.1 histidine--tRNA ligase [Bryobacteraceae bacterium]
MIRAVKGMRDLLPPATGVWNYVEDAARRVFRSYNYHEIRTPVLEETQLFARGVGEETDIVTKEMYTFEDRDGSSLTLRPEATASVIRAYIEHRLDQRPGVQKLYYIGPMFRRERPQKGRYRQFFQIGAEAIGSESPFLDAEVIEMVVELFRAIRLEGFKLLLNSVGCPECRKAFSAKLREELAKVAPSLCADCRRRAETNPLRVLDCKVPEDQPIIDALPSILDHLCEGCRTHFDAVQRYLTDRAIEFEIRPRLVRGLDYYTRTTFEVVHGALGAQNSVMGGGRYDGLAEALGSKIHSPGIGFSIGEDRLVMSLEESRKAEFTPELDVFIAPLGEPALRECAIVARELRRSGLAVEIAPEGRLKRAMELANKLAARFALIVGEDEIASGKYTLKNMASGEQQSVAMEELLRVVRG